jgi:hypothetical protein
MSGPDATTNNTAGSASVVGIQAEQVHNSNVYQVLPDDPPQRKYEVGVRFLEDGVPTRARELIEDAIARGYDNSEVRFHWVLSMLSKRAYRDLTPEERATVDHTPRILCRYAEDEWKHALEVICELLNHFNDSGGPPGVALKELLALHTLQRSKVIRHLDFVLTAGMRDNLWAETLQEAETARTGNGRTDRVWAYFHPDPIPPRVRQPANITTTDNDRLRATARSGIFVIADGYLGWLVLVNAAPLPILAYLLALAAGYIAARNGLEWRYRITRLAVRDRDYFGPARIDRTPANGFTNQVGHSFTHYSNKYAPAGADRGRWPADTAGIRDTLRHEIADLYRESRISVGRVNWLIRHLVSDIRTQWGQGTLLAYREQYRVEWTTRVWCFLSLAALIAATMDVIVAAVQINPLPAVLATIAILVSGRGAARGWLSIISERRRYTEDCQERDHLLAQRQAAYQRWMDRLDSIRPSEGEMETWLNCDKTMVVDKALRHYRLAWRDIIAHSFLQTPANNCKRARVRGGPWRYSKYDIRLFLITRDGVREVSTELDFEHVTLNGQERYNFHFDAVSSVHVIEAGALNYTLELTLSNGPTRNIQFADPETGNLDLGEDPAKLSIMNLDTAGFVHTLHILEGIAAEGKNWINRDPHVNSNIDDPAPINEIL